MDKTAISKNDMELTDTCGMSDQMQQLPEFVRCATMAPSGHNTQPWKFSITGDCIRIFPDFTRALSVVDPDNRELYISRLRTRKPRDRS